MKRSKTVSLILAALLFVCVLAGCGGGSKYADNVAASDIAARVEEAIGRSDGSMVVFDEAYVKGSMQMDPSAFADYVFEMNSVGTSIDEFGIVKAKSASEVKAVEKQVEDYLKFRNDNWNPSYLADERPKMEAASFKTFGNYVVYAVLDDSTKEAAFKAVESCLMEG